MTELVQAPVRQPRSGGIKDVIPGIIPVERLGGPAALAWEDSTCAFPAQTRTGCWDTEVDPADKAFDGVSQYTSIAAAFALYGGAECWIGGDSEGKSYAEQAATILEQGEDRAIEAKLVLWAVGAPTPGTAASISAAIGAADKAADADYVGRPVLILPRDLAQGALAAGALVREDGKLVTANGTPVISTSAYDAADSIAIIGQPAVYGTSVRAADTVSPSENLARAIAERVYAIGVDCGYRHVVNITTTP